MLTFTQKVAFSIIAISCGVCLVIMILAITDLISLANAETFQAQTFEHQRQPYGKIHGKIKINGKSFDFVSGGRGRGSAPFGTYSVGKLGGFKTSYGTFIPGFPLSDAYDPLVKDTRTGLFVHPGQEVSAGCFAIRNTEWHSFVSILQSTFKSKQKVELDLEPATEPMTEPSPLIEIAFHKHKKHANKRNHGGGASRTKGGYHHHVDKLRSLHTHSHRHYHRYHHVG